LAEAVRINSSGLLPGLLVKAHVTALGSCARPKNEHKISTIKKIGFIVNGIN
jgi:hypothetical protein